MDEIKQAIIVRTDIKMGVGKLAAQVAHASLMSYFECAKKDGGVAAEWLREGEKKIVLKTADEKDLEKLFAAFKFKKIPCALVADAGLTQIPPGRRLRWGWDLGMAQK